MSVPLIWSESLWGFSLWNVWFVCQRLFPVDALKLDKTNNNSGHLLLSGPFGGCDSLSLNLFCRMLLIGTDASVSGAVRSSCRSGDQVDEVRLFPLSGPSHTSYRFGANRLTANHIQPNTICCICLPHCVMFGVYTCLGKNCTSLIFFCNLMCEERH